MSFCRISLCHGNPPAFLKAFSDGLHEALAETFEVPAEDRFQVIHQHAPEELVFDPHYLCGPRSSNFIPIADTAGRRRSPGVKQAFYRRLAELLVHSPRIRSQDLMVVISTTEAEDWSFGNGAATMLATRVEQVRDPTPPEEKAT